MGEQVRELCRRDRCRSRSQITHVGDERRHRQVLRTCRTGEDRIDALLVESLLVDQGHPWHLAGVIVEGSHLVTASAEISFRSRSNARRWSCLIAPGDLPSASATCSIERSPTTRRSTTSR